MIALLALLALASTPYEGAWAESVRLEAAGEPAAAAAALAPTVARFPQDYALTLRLAWLHFQAGAWPAAERGYREAMALSGGAYEARLGLAWTRLRQGHRDDAAALFRALVDERPTDATARAGLAEAQTPTAAWSVTPSLGVGYEAYGDHPDLTDGGSLLLGLVGRRAPAWARVAWRQGRYDLDTATWRRRGVRAGSTDWRVLHVGVGAEGRAGGAGLHYARLLDGPAHVFGATGRARDLGLQTTWDTGAGGVATAGLSLALDAAPWLRVTPSVVGQWLDAPPDEDAAFGGAGGLDVVLHGRGAALRVGVRGGRLHRPVDYTLPAIYSVRGAHTVGGVADGSVRLGRFTLAAGFELARIEVDDQAALARWVGGSVGYRFGPLGD